MRGPYGKLWTEFFPSFYGPSAKRAGHENEEGKKRGSITCPTDWANEANKMFILWLYRLFQFWNGDWELEVRTGTYGPGIDQSQHAKSVSHIIRINIYFFWLIRARERAVFTCLDCYYSYLKKVIMINSWYWNRKELWGSSSNNLLLLALTLHNIESRFFWNIRFFVRTSKFWPSLLFLYL